MKPSGRINILKFFIIFFAIRCSTNIYDGKSDEWNAACILVSSIEKILNENNVLLTNEQLILMKIHHFHRSLFNINKYPRLNAASQDFEGFIKDEKGKKVTIKFSYCNNWDDSYDYHVEELLKNSQDIIEFALCDKIHEDLFNRYNYKIENEETLIKASNTVFKCVKKLKIDEVYIKIYDKNCEDKNTLDLHESLGELKKRTEKDIYEVIKTFIYEINDDIKFKIIKNGSLNFDEKSSPFNDFVIKKIIRSILLILENVICSEDNLLFEIVTIRFDKDFNVTFIINNYIYIDNNFQKETDKRERILMFYNGSTYRYTVLGDNNREGFYQLQSLIFNRLYFIYDYIYNLIVYHIEENLKKTGQYQQEYGDMLVCFDRQCFQYIKQDVNTVYKNVWNFLHEHFFDKVLLKFDALFVELKTIKYTEDLIFTNTQRSIMIINKRNGEKISFDFNKFYKKHGKAGKCGKYSHLYFDIFINDVKVEPNLLGEEEFKQLKEKIETLTKQLYILKLLNAYEDFKDYKFCHLSSDTTCETCLMFKEDRAYYLVSNRIADPNGIIKLYHGSEIDITFFKQHLDDIEEIKEEYYCEVVKFIDEIEESVEDIISHCFDLNSLKEEENLVLVPIFFTYIPFLGIKITKYDKLESRLKSLFYISKYEILITNYKKKGFKELYLGMYMRNPETIEQVPYELDKLIKKIKILMHCESLKVLVKKNFDMNDLKSLSKSAFENALSMFEDMVVIKKTKEL